MCEFNIKEKELLTKVNVYVVAISVTTRGIFNDVSKLNSNNKSGDDCCADRKDA